MFKGLMRRSSSSSTPDGRSQSNSNSKKSSGIWRKKTDSKSKATSRGDDRDRSLGDLPADSTPPSPGRRSYEPSVASESAVKVDRDTRGARRRDRERSSSPEPVPRRLNRDQSRSRDGSASKESNQWREPQRWPPGDVSLPPLDTGAAHTTSDQFVADIASPGFSQFPMQYDNNYNYDSPNYNNPVSIPPPLMPGHPDSSPTSPATFDPHVPQQFPGQFPDNTAEPYRPYNNPAGEAADYYGDQGQSVQDQPGVRPNPPLVIPNSQAHLMPASPGANPPPEPSSMGQVGSAAEFYADSPDLDNPVPQQQPPEEPPKPSKPNKPSAAPAGVLSGPPSYDTSDSPVPPEASGSAGTQPVEYTQNSPTQSHSMGPAIGAAAAAAAVGYMANHHHNSSTSSSEHPLPSSYTQNHEPYSPIGQPGPAIYPNPALNNPNYASHPNHPDHEAVYHSSPFQSGGLAFQQRQRGPLDKFIDFWKDHEGVGMYEEYTEAIGVCKYCFEPGTTSRDAPRKHNYQPRRRSPDRFSNDSRVNKSSRYSSPSDDESRRRRSSSRRSWFGGLFSGSAAKALFESQDFEDSYKVRPSRVSSPRLSSSDSESDSDRKSKPSRRRRRSSLSQSPGGSRRNSYSDPRRSRYEGPRLRSRSRSSSDSRSRSSSRSDRHSPIRDFALGAAVGSVAAAATSRPQKKRSRSPKRKGKGRKESTTEDSSSSSYLDISRPTTAGSLGSFFNTPSENKKKPMPKSRKGFFPFSNNNSSSSSLDDDLAFGTAYAKKPKKSKKGKGRKKNEDVNAKLLELSAMATALAGSTQGRRSGEILASKDPRSRWPQSAPSAPKDDEWEDYSEGQESSVSSALAFGGSSQYGGSSSSSNEDSSDSGTSKWNWRWGSKKDKKKNEQKKDSPSHGHLSTGSILAGTALGTAALASGYRKEGEHFSSPSSSSSESLQKLDPIPTSDPPRCNASSFPPSSSAQEPAFILPGPIPLQQPQPVTPVSQAVYSSQGEPAPVYNAPTVPPFFPPDAFYDPASGRRDDVYPQRSDVSSNWNRTHRRRESSPDFYPGPFQDFTPSSHKRRPTDQASVQFDLTEEQEDKERRAARRERERRDNDRDQDIQLPDHEIEEENERREPRRAERVELEPERGRSRSRSRSSTRRDRSPDRPRWDDVNSSSWIGPAAAGTIGAAVAAAAVPSGAPSESASESSQRHRERSEKRRAERVPPFSEAGWDHPARDAADERPEPRSEPADVDVDVENESQIAPEDQSSPGKNPTTRTSRTKPTHESYATYFAPKEDRHGPDAQTEHRENAPMSMIPEDEPEPPLQQDIEPPSKYLGGLPWAVPRLNLIEPTPPHSQNGSVRDVVSPDPSAAEPSQKEEAPRREQGSTTGSRVSWGGNETHEFEVHSTSSEQDSDYEMADEPNDMRRGSVDHGMDRESEGMQRDSVDCKMGREPEGMKRGHIQQDIEFATILDATTKDAGFDPAITADPYYNTRSSPPQTEHREFSEYEPFWPKPAHYIFEPHGAGRNEVQTPPREEREPEATESAPEVKGHRDAIRRFNAPKAKETMPGSFEEEPVQPTEDPSRPVVEEKRPRDNDRPPKRRSSRDGARDDPRKTAIDVSRPEPIGEEPRNEKEPEVVNNDDISPKEDRDVRAPAEFAPIALAAFPPKPISEEPRSAKKQEPAKNENPWEDYHQPEAPRETERPVSPPSPGSGYRMSQDDLNRSELVLGELPKERERPVSPPSPGSGYRMSQDDLEKNELVFGETPRETERPVSPPSPGSGYRMSQDDLNRSELALGELTGESEHPVSPPSPGSGYRMSQDDLNKSELVLGEIPRAPSPSGYRLSQDDLSKSELIFGEMPRAPSPSGYRLSQDDLDRSEFVLEDHRKPVPPRETEPAPAVSKLPLRRGRRSQDKLHSRNDNVASSNKGPKPKEASEDYLQSTRAPSGDTSDFHDRSQPTSQQQQQRPQKFETTTRQGPKEPSPATKPRELPIEEYRGKDERNVAPEEARKARGLKDTVPAPRPLIWNEPRSEDGPAPAVKDDAAFENNSRPRVSKETSSDEFVLAPNGEERRRRDEPDSNNDNVPENERGTRGEEDINVQRYRFSRQQREEKRQREEERRRQEAEGIAGPNGQTRDEHEKDRKDAEEHGPARSAETPVKVDDGKDNTGDLKLSFPLSVPESRLRSRSIPSPGSAKAMVEVGPKSRSRPTSPESNLQRQSLHATDGDRPRRISMLQDSPTAIPLQFRCPPSTSPTGRRSPSVGSPEPHALSLSSPPERRARRRSMEFVDSREIMPLFLVEQNGQHQHPIEHQLPSLPSSKSSSRTSSPVKNLRPDGKGRGVVEPLQDENAEEQSKPKLSTVVTSQEPISSQEEQPKPEPSTVIPSQEPALSQEEQPKDDLLIPTQDSAELEKEGERGISREMEVGEPIDEPLPPLPSSHGSLNASVEDLNVVPDAQSWKVLDLTHDIYPEEEPKPDITTRSEGRCGEEEHAKEGNDGKESEKPEAQEPIDESSPPPPSRHGSLNSPARDLETDPNEKDWKAFDLTQDVHPKEEIEPGPSRELSGEGEPKEENESERHIQKVETQAPINEQFPPPPSSNGSLNASVEDLSAVPDEQTWDPVDLAEDTQFEEQLKPELSISTPDFQFVDEPKPSSSITNPSHKPIDGGEMEKESGAKDISEKAVTQEPVDEPLTPLSSSKGSSLNAIIENLVPGEEDWNPIDMSQAVHEDQPELGLSFQEPVGGDEEKEIETGEETTKGPEQVDEQPPPLPLSKGSSLNASMEDLSAVPGEEDWNPVDLTQAAREEQPDLRLPSREPVDDGEKKEKTKTPAPIDEQLPPLPPSNDSSLNASVEDLGVVSGEDSWNIVDQLEKQPKPGFPTGIPSQEPIGDRDSQPEDKPKSELTIKFPSQEPVLNQEAQPEDQFERGFSMTPHSLEPILEEAEDEIQPDPSTTISSQPVLNRDTPINYEPQPDPSVTIPQEPSGDDNLEKEKEKGKWTEKGLSDSQEEPPTEQTTYNDTTLEMREKDTSGWEVVVPVQNALPEEQAEPDFSSIAPSQQQTLRQDVQPDQPHDVSITPQEVAGEEESKKKGNKRTTDPLDAQQEQPTKERVEKDPPPPYLSHEEDEAVTPIQDVQPEPEARRKPSLSIAIPSQEPEDELDEKYAKAREKDTDFHEFDTIDEEWTASEIMREREKHKHEFDIHSPAELLWDPHKYFITPRSVGGLGSRSLRGSLAPRPYEPSKSQDNDIDLSDPDENISLPESGPSGPPGKETSKPEPTGMTAPTQEEKSENFEDSGLASTRDEEEQPKEIIPETQHSTVGEDKAFVPDIEVTPPVKDEIIPTVPVTAPKEEEQAPSTPDFGDVVDTTVAAAVDARESHPAPETQTDVKEDEPAVPEIEITPAVKDNTALTVSDVPVPAIASKEDEQTQSNYLPGSAATVDAAFAVATGSTDYKAVHEEGVARDLPVESKGNLSSKVPPLEGSTAATESDYLGANQQSEDGQESYRTLSPIMEEPDLESERSQSVDLAYDEQTPSQESEKMESEAPAADDTSVSRAPLGKQSPVPEREPTAIAPETERAPNVTTENVQNTGEANQPSDEAQSVTTTTSRDGYAESAQDSGTDFWDAVEKHEGEGSIASPLDRPIDTSEPSTPREWRTEVSFEPEVPAQGVQVSPVEKFSRSTSVEKERQDAGVPKPEDQLLEKTGKTGKTQVPTEAQNAISQSDTTRDETQRQIEPAVVGNEQVLGELPEKTEQPITDEPKNLVKPALEVVPEAAADTETPAKATERFPQAKSKEEYEKDRRFFSSLEPLTETETEHSQSADAAAGAGTFETSGEIPATIDACHQSPEPAGAQDVELVPAASESESIPVRKSESNIAAHGLLSLKAEQTPAPAPLSEPGTTPENKQNVEDSGERRKDRFPSTTLDEAVSIELPSTPHTDIADVNVPAVTSDTLPFSIAPSKQASQEKPIEIGMPHFIADNESLADVVTRTSKKKAKKERRKKRHSASLDESVPATLQYETDSINNIAPVKAPSVDKDNAIFHEPTEAIPEQPRDDAPPADIEHREAPETSVEQEPPKSNAPIYLEDTIVQGHVAGAENIQEKVQDKITPPVETSGSTAESTITEPESTREERDITTSVEPVSTSSDHVEEAPEENLAVGTNAPVQAPTATEPSSAKDVPQDDAAHAQDQPESAATVTENFQELPSLEKDNEEAPVTEPPSRTNSKNKKNHRRSASSEVEQPAPAEEIVDTPSIEVPSEPPTISQAGEEKPVESLVTEFQEEPHPTMSKKQAKRERKKRRSMGQSPDGPPVEPAQPSALHEAPAQELQQQLDNDTAVNPSQPIPDNASAEGFEMIDAPSNTPIESITPDLQELAKAEEPWEAPAQKANEAIAQVPQAKEKEEPKSDLEARPFKSKSKGAGLLNPTSETAQEEEPGGSTLHPADAEDTSSLPRDAKNKVRHHRRRRSRILEHLAEAEAERERAKQASTEENPTGTLPVTESKPTAPAEDSDLWTDPLISSQIEQGREVPFAFPSSEQVDDNQVVPALNEEPRTQSSQKEPEAFAGPLEVNKNMESQADHDSQVEQRTQKSASTPSSEENVPETAPVMEEKTKEFMPANQEIAELPSTQIEKSERSLDIIRPILANEPAATVDVGEVIEKPASDIVPSQTHEQPPRNQEETMNPQETVLPHNSPTTEPRQDSTSTIQSRKRPRKEKKRARKRTKENHEGSASPEGILSESTAALIEQPPLVSEQVESTELPQGVEKKVFAEEQTKEAKAKVVDPDTTGEKAVQEPVDQPHRRGPIEPVEAQPTARLFENEQPPTQEKRKEAQREKQAGNLDEGQVTMQEPRSNDKAVNEPQTKKTSGSAPEPSTTPRLLNRVASIFPDLKRETFRLPSKNQSVKDRAEDETTEPEVSRRFENEHAAWVSEAPITSQDYQRERLSSAEPFEDEPSFQLSTTTNPETTITDVAIDVDIDEFYKVSILSDRTTSGSPAIEIDPILGDSAENAEQSPDSERSAHVSPSSDEQSYTAVDPSSTQANTSRGISPSRDLRRSPTKTPSSRSLAPSPPLPEPRDRVERTDGVRTTDRSGKPRLEIKPVESLRPRTPRSTSPIRKYTGNVWAQQATEKHGENPVMKPPVRQNSLPAARRPQTPERKPILRPSSMSNFHDVPTVQQTPHSPDVPRSLRRKSKTTRDMSGDLRAASRALQEENGSQPPPTDINIERIASSSSYDPVTDKGKRPIRGMTDVYEAWGETPSSPRSPSRPPSVRHRRSMQHLQQLESRLDQLISENRLLSAEREAAEDKLKKTTLARRKSDQALNSQNTDLRDRSEEVEELRKSVEWFQKEVNRLTEENEGLTGTNANLAATHEREHREFQESSAREIQELRTRYRQATANTRDLIRRELDVHLAQKNAELRRLSEELQEEQEKVQQLQQKLATSEVLVHRNDQFFRAACHNLYARVQHWVKRFSKHSDHRNCRTFHDMQKDQKLAARFDIDKLTGRFDNAILDGSDVEYYLADRVGRRDVFISVVMTMMWKFIFAPYMFGMDSEKQQKLNSLEEQLTEAGKLAAVRRWRATTLSLLSKSPSFAEQREIEMEAVTREIYDTLESVCPPPEDKTKKLREDLHGVLQIAVTLSIEMRTQLAEYYIVRPLLAEFGANGVVTRRVHFNKALMNEHSALDSGAGEGSVRLFLFPLVVKEHDDSEEEDDKHDDKKEDKGPVVIYPAQVLVNRPKEVVEQLSKSLDRKSSVQSSVPSLRMDST